MSVSWKRCFCTRKVRPVLGSLIIRWSPRWVNLCSSTSRSFCGNFMLTKPWYKMRWRNVRRPCNLSLQSTDGNNSSRKTDVRIKRWWHTSGSKHRRLGLKPHLRNFSPANLCVRVLFDSRSYISYRALTCVPLCREATRNALRPLRHLHLLHDLQEGVFHVF